MKLHELSFLTLFGVVLASCSNECSNSIMQTVKSPDEKMLATVFTRSCGATVGDSVHVYLGSVADKSYELGNVFRGTKSSQCEINWINSSQLKITTDADVVLLMKEYGGVEFIIDKKNYSE